MTTNESTSCHIHKLLFCSCGQEISSSLKVAPVWCSISRPHSSITAPLAALFHSRRLKEKQLFCERLSIFGRFKVCGQYFWSLHCRRRLVVSVFHLCHLLNVQHARALQVFLQFTVKIPKHGILPAMKWSQSKGVFWTRGNISISQFLSVHSSLFFTLTITSKCRHAAQFDFVGVVQN